MSKRFELKNKVALVTGASSGIGQALCMALAKEGCHIILFARRKDKLQEVTTECLKFGIKAIPFVGDVNQTQSLLAAVECAKSEFGRLDLVVANAGICLRGQFFECSTNDFRKQFETNFFGVLDTLYAALSEVKKSQGQMVVIGSAAGHVAVPGGSPYTCSKFALRALVDSIRLELSHSNIGLTHVSPGLVATDMLPQTERKSWRTSTPQKAAEGIVSAIIQRKSEKYLDPFTHLAIVIHRFFPGIINMLARKV